MKIQSLLSVLFFTTINLNAQTTQQAITLPITTGFMVYHNYSNYNNWDANLYLFNFSTNINTDISSGWNIDHEMNANISPDGTKLVFMGDDGGLPRDWDIYTWTIGTNVAPVNLTMGNGLRDEDPKFSPDGNSIVFKQEGDIKVINNITNTVSEITTNGFAIEESMPFYTTNGQQIVYALGSDANGDIYSIDSNGNNNSALYNVAGVLEYFPIVKDSTSFFYTRWKSPTDFNDQIYLGYFSGNASSSIAINDTMANNSDAYPIGADYLAFSSTRAGGIGGYDIYLGQLSTGFVWNLNNYFINTSTHELGACYYGNNNTTTNIKQNYCTIPVTVYPNPTLNNITISTNNNNEPIHKIEIINVLGQIMLTQKTMQPLVNIAINDLEDDVYFVKIYTLNEIKTVKIKKGK